MIEDNTKDVFGDAFPVIKGYKFVRFMGSGGMGSTWKAIQLSTHREVAIKFLSWDKLVSKKSIDRFKREVMLAARLNHPNIVHIYDSGLYHDRLYYVMELVEGIHLDKHVIQNNLSMTQTIGLIIKICRAMDYAHKERIIHRDIKPANIIITADGEPHILDFGLAKLESIDDTFQVSVSIEGEVSGTLGYMSPEQAAGEIDKIDARTDIYSIGVMLYRLITGKSPYPEATSYYETLRNIIEGKVISPRQRDRQLPHSLSRIILTAMNQNASERFSSAAELADELVKEINNGNVPSEIIHPKKTDHNKNISGRRKYYAAFALAAVIVIGITYKLITSNNENFKQLPLVKSGNEQTAIKEQPEQFTISQEKENQARACYRRLNKLIEKNDFIRASFTSADLKTLYPDTAFYKEYQDQIKTRDNTIDTWFKDQQIEDMEFYVADRSYNNLRSIHAPYDRRFPTRASYINRQAKAVLRVFLEDEMNENTAVIKSSFQRIDIDGRFVTGPVKNGDLVILDDPIWRFSETRKPGYVEIKTLHHHKIRIDFEISANTVTDLGDIYIRKIPSRQKGTLVVNINPEQDLLCSGGKVTLEGGLADRVIDDSLTCTFADIAEGQYQLSLSKPGVYNYTGKAVQVIPGQTQTYTINVAKMQTIYFKWRFYNRFTKEEYSGTSEMNTSSAWRPDRLWDDLKHVIFRISDWDGSSASISGTFGNLIAYDSSQQFEDIAFPLSLMAKRQDREIPVETGRIYAWWNDFPSSQFECVIHITDIKPVR